MQLGKCRVKDKYLVVFKVIVSETTGLWIYLILLVDFFLPRNKTLNIEND